LELVEPFEENTRGKAVTGVVVTSGPSARRDEEQERTPR
jgi:hypothetical protein